MTSPDTTSATTPRAGTVRTAIRIIAIGTCVGGIGLGLFATLHALVIKPVWSELAGGIPFVLAIGVTVAWAYHEFVTGAPRRLGVGGGLKFGALMWLSAWPATALANLVRMRSDAPLEAWVVYAAGALSLAGGALALWLVTRSRRAAAAGAVGALALLAAGGGPLAAVQGGRVVGLWLGLLILESLGGVVLAILYRRWGAPRNTVILQQ